MFGSKLRSWMENHIVRPRKKGNKNKNANSGNLAPSNAQNGHKGSSYQGGDSPAIASPARRSEVSPIQSHTTSRAGWQSPQQECAVSPKSDHYLYRHSVKSCSPLSSSPQAMLHQHSSYTLENTNNSVVANSTHHQPTQPQHHQLRPHQQSHQVLYHQSQHHHPTHSQHNANNQPPMVNTQQYASVDSQQQHHFSKTIDLHQRTTLNYSSTTASSSSTSNEMLLDQKYPKYERIYSEPNGSMSAITGTPTTRSNAMENQFQLKNNHRRAIETSSSTTSSSSAAATTNANKYENEVVAHDQPPHHQPEGVVTTMSVAKLLGKQHPASTEHRYGKILQHNRNGESLAKTMPSSPRRSRPPTLPSPPPPPSPLTTTFSNPLTGSNYDQFNSNVSYQLKCDNGIITAAVNNSNSNSNNNNNFNNNYNNNNNTNNNNHSTSSSSSSAAGRLQQTITPAINSVNNNHHHAAASAAAAAGHHVQQRMYATHNGNATTGGGSCGCVGSGMHHPSGLMTGVASVVNPAAPRRNGSETNRNMLRTNRYSNGTHLTAPGGTSHQLAHMINSLSSPESAYSTGYSTDGTSPGATYTPEYYINMRTGTHYFPRGVGAVAAVEQSRQKFGLNKIDETVVGGHSDTAHPNANYHRRTESLSCELSRRHFGHNANNGIATEEVARGHKFLTNNMVAAAAAAVAAASPGMSPDVQRRLALQTYKAMESPSPRQRCRIRTNPWFSNIDPAIVAGMGSCKQHGGDMETSSTSSGIKSSSDAGMEDNVGKKIISSGSESSSSATEIEVSNKKTFSPNTIRKRRMEMLKSEALNGGSQVDSDEDATLNEMMGKFDESYCYEKETDILSDSDPTECISDLDTGQDGGDECDTDDLLDIDFIDTGSMQEIVDNHLYENTGSCSYFQPQSPLVAADKRQSRVRKSSTKNGKTEDSTSSRRRKRLTRTRKSSRDCRDSSVDADGNAVELLLPVSTGRDRGCKSLGGTPVSLRRNKTDNNSKSCANMRPLNNRSNSLTFTEIHSIRSRFLAAGESEKALLKADIEADVKYKQLIHEAETILVSMKTTTTSPSMRETPVPSPRRICSMPTNKRVEMLRNCEADLRRELAKAQKLNGAIVAESNGTPADTSLLINKRIEVLKIETTTTTTTTTSVPNSPITCRFSPRKTHVSNFIYQNATPTDLMRRKSSPEPHPTETQTSKYSPQLQLNGRRLLSPPKSPTPTRRRFRSQSPRVSIDSDTDSDTVGTAAVPPKVLTAIRKTGKRTEPEVNGNKENMTARKSCGSRKLIKSKSDARDELRNLAAVSAAKHNHLISFRSVDMGNQMPGNGEYCPQSEPLKRKIYSGSQTLEKLKKNLEMESEIPKKALLQKISQLRRERKAAAKAQQYVEFEPMNYHLGHEPQPPLPETETTATCMKRQLILHTIADLKRNLEDQSVELCGLNDENDDDD